MDSFLLRIKRKNILLLLIVKRRTTTVFTARDEGMALAASSDCSAPFFWGT
jgi:hypothetical protein